MNEKLGLVVADYNADITHLMAQIAEEHATFLGAEVVKTIRVPGTFDVPLATKRLIGQPHIQGVITLGAVIEGDTDHDTVVAHNASRKIADLSLQYDKPISLGICGPKITHAQANRRIEQYAKRATETVVKMIRRLK